ncbi:MAG: hypothetical protein R2912_08760 [Eubacteriales bacterium]
MKTKVRKLDGLSRSRPVLDEERPPQTKELAELVLREYEASGRLTGNALNEKVTEYEKDIAGYLADELIHRAITVFQRGEQRICRSQALSRHWRAAFPGSLFRIFSDILIITVLIYKLIVWTKETRAYGA